MSAVVCKSLSEVYDKGEEYAKITLSPRVDEINAQFDRKVVELITISQSESLKPLVDRVSKLREYGEVATMSDIDNTIIKQRLVPMEGKIEKRSVPIIPHDTVENMQIINTLSHLYYISARPVLTWDNQCYRERTSKQLTGMGFPASFNQVRLGYGDAKLPQINPKSKGMAIEEICAVHPAVRSVVFQDDLKLELLEVLESAYPKLQKKEIKELLLVHREVTED